jgi:hypothetical protein
MLTYSRINAARTWESSYFKQRLRSVLSGWLYIVITYWSDAHLKRHRRETSNETHGYGQVFPASPKIHGHL